jgi:hypothetical protein
VISYLAALPSRDLITAARQQLTHEWWRRRRPHFEVYVSQLVLDEAGRVDRDAAARRATFMGELPLLEMAPAALDFARQLLDAVGLPPQAAVDALHISIAACNGMEYQLTWNSAHIANAEYRARVERACRQQGYEPPVLCTPDELMGEAAP